MSEIHKNSAVHSLNETQVSVDGASAATPHMGTIGPSPRSLSKKNAVHVDNETHVPHDGASAAIVETNTKRLPPRFLSKKRAVQKEYETQAFVDGASAATNPAKPIDRSPRSLSKKRASDGVRPATKRSKPMRKPPGISFKKRAPKSARAAIETMKPNQPVPPTPSKTRSRKAASPAIIATKPSACSPGTPSPKRGRQKVTDTQVTRATASPAIDATQPKILAPGTPSPKRGRQILRETHVIAATARRSTSRAKPKSSPSGDNSEGLLQSDTQPIAALEGRAIYTKQPRSNTPDHSLRDGQRPVETQLRDAVAGDDQLNCETQTATVIATIQELWRRRQSWHRAEKSLTLQCSAICRHAVGARGITKGMTRKEIAANKVLLAQAAAMLDRIESGETTAADESAAISCLPILAGRAPVREQRKRIEKELERLARSLPVHSWTQPIYGFAELSLAALVGECGDIGSYKSASALWKRMGLAVIKGGRQRRVGGIDALEHGYSPQRRSVMWNIGGGLIGGMGKGPRPKLGEDIEAREDWSPYQKDFVRLLRLEVERVTDTWNGPEHKRDPVERKGETYESFSAHAAARCKRRIEKQFLAEFYGAWRSEYQRRRVVSK